jgi:hypothetical protein
VDGPPLDDPEGDYVLGRKGNGPDAPLVQYRASRPTCVDGQGRGVVVIR